VKAQPKRDERTVYVVDDDEAVRDALAMLLSGEGLQARTFASPLDFLADYRHGGPDCLLLDVRMPQLSGLEVQRKLIERGARIPVIFISGHGDIPMAVEAVHRGALDFLVKPFDDDALLRRVRDAFGSAGGQRRGLSRGIRLRRISTLTAREREVLGRILDGKTNRAVAEEFSVTSKAIEYHRARIMRKLRVRSAAELFRFCLDA
jgi:two-component system, LuxR family, response regulator FixJ